MINAANILKVTKSVTSRWTRQRKAEERGSRSRGSRDFLYSGRVNFSDVAAEILPAGYAHAAGGGKYTVSKRQLYYACREQFLEQTGRVLEADYFSNTLLVQYRNRHPETAAWKVTADPRGNLTIPNVGHDVRIPCGTLPIERHVESVREDVDPFEIDAELRVEWPSQAAGQRYQAVLYIEKEGFEPQLQEAKIAERFDLAILSCKGMSNVAGRIFVDNVCAANGGVPLFVVHDFDKAGFEISQRLTTVSARAKESDRIAYEFQNEINVTDLGLRLADVQIYKLAAEHCEFRGHFAADSICTPSEREFLQSGRRVELNAFTSPQFIEWLEAKLTAHGLGKGLIPPHDVVAAAYRRSLAIAAINASIEPIREDAIESAESAIIPKTLRRQLKQAMKKHPEAWDKALYRIARTMAES